MTEQFPADEQLTVTGPATASKSSPAEFELLAKQLANNPISIAAGIALAGGAYPIVLAAIGSIVEAFGRASNTQGAGHGFGDTIAVLLSLSVLGAGIGALWASTVAVVTLSLVYLFVRSLELRGNAIRFGAFCGGLVGFVAVLPLFIGGVNGVFENPTEPAPLVLLGPALSTIVGQLGGAWGAWRTRWYKRAVTRAAADISDELVELPTDSSKDKDSVMAHPRRPQFGIRHLLIVCIWTSLLLTAFRLSGLDYWFLLLLLGGWIVYQAVTLSVGGLLASGIGNWRTRRQSCST